MALIGDNLKEIPLPKNTVAVAQEDGRIYTVDFTEFPQIDNPDSINWDLSVAKLILSKIQLTRTSLGTLEEIEIENIIHTDQFPAGTNVDTELLVFGSLDGKNDVITTKPVISVDENGYALAKCRVTAKNFAIMYRGAYNINTIQVTIHKNGRR